MRAVLKIAFTALLLLATSAAAEELEDAFFSKLDAMPPAERYRQLTLMLLVSDGADSALMRALESRVDESGELPDNQSGTFDFDAYTTPLIRIVDQESMLAGATRLFRFTRDHAAAIGQRLEQLRETQSGVVQAIPQNVITEDAIIIRNAIADSIDYAEIQARGAQSGGTPERSRGYRERTIYLRNNMEYAAFTDELDRITAEAVASVGGQSEAYQRMFDDEVDTAGLDKKIEAAEFVYGWDEEFDERAARMAEEILENIWDRESTIDP